MVTITCIHRTRHRLLKKATQEDSLAIHRSRTYHKHGNPKRDHSRDQADENCDNVLGKCRARVAVALPVFLSAYFIITNNGVVQELEVMALNFDTVNDISFFFPIMLIEISAMCR